MALKDAEIAALKAGIPAQFQPPPGMSGALSANFHDQGAMLAPYSTLQGSAPLSASEPNAFTDEHTREMQGRIQSGDPDAAPGFMLTGVQATKRNNDEFAANKKREKERTLRALLLDALDRRLDELNAELARIDERLEEIRRERMRLGEGMEALDDLQRLAVSGQLDPNNPAHAALLRRAGINPEEADKDNIANLIAQRRRDMNREDDALDHEGDALLKHRDEVVAEKKEVEAARAEIESADTPEAMEKAEHRARTVLGSQQLGDAAYQTEQAQAKQIAADAVGISAKSENFNREAATENSETIFASDEGSFELDGPPSKPFTPSPV